MPSSKLFRLNSYDWKSLIQYILYIGSLIYLANESGVREYIIQYLNQPTVDIIMVAIGVLLKKFLTDYSAPALPANPSN